MRHVVCRLNQSPGIGELNVKMMLGTRFPTNKNPAREDREVTRIGSAISVRPAIFT